MNPTDYPILLVYSSEDAAWLARVDLLPGCISDGATPEEALSNVKIAIKEWLEINRELGRPIPRPLDQEGFDEIAVQEQAQMLQVISQAVQHGLQQIQKPSPSSVGGLGFRGFPAVLDPSFRGRAGVVFSGKD